MMAPLYSPCFQLSQVYSPLSSRKLNHLPGSQARSVPFVRPTRSISRFQHQVRAAAEPMTAADQNTGNGSGSSYDLEDDGCTAATRAVHGGERAGRPRVSGRSWLA